MCDRSRRNTSEGLRRKPSGKGRAGTAAAAAVAQLKQESAAEDAAADPRRPSVEDLALTENLIPEERGAFQIGDLLDDDDDDVPVEYSVKKLSDLDPRFVSAPAGDGSTTAAVGAAAVFLKD